MVNGLLGYSTFAEASVDNWANELEIFDTIE